MTANRYAFYFDSTSCSGCKACQIACKDKHNLEIGRIWRRVFEITGGSWIAHENSWQSNVFSYNVSISCNHCDRPICMEVCPTSAISKRSDGIVLIDQTNCVGCGYCQWACPYNAPQLDPASRKMTKCTLCFDYLDAGKPPACVAACPLRVLDFGEYTELREKYKTVEGIFPLPEHSLTEPSLIISPHKDSHRAYQEPAQISNLEEI